MPRPGVTGLTISTGAPPGSYLTFHILGKMIHAIKRFSSTPRRPSRLTWKERHGSEMKRTEGFHERVVLTLESCNRYPVPQQDLSSEQRAGKPRSPAMFPSCPVSVDVISQGISTVANSRPSRCIIRPLPLVTRQVRVCSPRF